MDLPKSKLERSQRLTLSRKSTRGKSSRPMTPVMTMAASALSGMWRNTGVRHSRTTPMRAAFTRPASPAPCHSKSQRKLEHELARGGI